jgi:hypothetical protein
MKAFRWSIVYDIEANLIIHVMSDRIKVSYHITENILTVIKDSELCNSLVITDIAIYHRKLQEYYQDAQLLKQFT